MATSQLSQRPLLVLIAAVVVHIILISGQVNTRTGVPLLQVATFGAFAELQRATMNTISSVRNVWTGYVDLTAVQKENEELKRQLQDVQVRLQEERAFAQRTESLRQLLELRDRAGVNTVAAEVIGAGAATDVRSYTIDKGSSDGVQRDLAAISPAGVVGRVIMPSRRAAQVQLLIDRNAAAAALIERTRAQGMVLGQGGDALLMEYVPGTADVKPGDLVLTSGMDAIYPKGFVIGTVESVDRGPGSFHKITIRPAVDFSRLEEVLVVTTPTSVKAAQAAEVDYVKQQPPPQARGGATNQSPTAAVAPGNQSARGPQGRVAPGNQTPRIDQPPRPRPAPPAANRTPAEPQPVGNQTPRAPLAQGVGE
jgi:rod shape-determining protein MreC